MITIFNRREIFAGFDMEESLRVRNVLRENGIEHIMKVINHTGSSRGRAGSFGLNMNYAYQYVVYVKRNDFDKAVYLVNKR